MIYSSRDTEWAASSRGNEWRRVSGHVLVVGRSKSRSHYWARVDDDFVDGYFETESDAKEACERRVSFLLDLRGY